MECVAYCQAQSYDMKPLRGWMKEHFLEIESMRDMVHGKDSGGGEFFCFDYGVIVFWGFDRAKREEIASGIARFAKFVRSQPVEEELVYHIGEKFQILNDAFTLQDGSWQTKLALSHAFAQSVKLESFEERVEGMMERSHKILSELAASGRIKMSRRDIARQLGVLIKEKSAIQLHCDELDTPDFFWESSELQPLYEAAQSYLDLSARLQVLHRRLDTVRDALEILSSELNHLHSAFLEWIIIILILIEVLFTFINFFGYGSHA